MCAYHRIIKYVDESKILPGQKLFPHLAAGAAFQTLRRYLAALGIAEFKKFGWKCVRAGKATMGAAKGMTLHEIISRGEWSSKSAPLHYIDEDIADNASRQKLAKVVDDSTSEDE